MSEIKDRKVVIFQSGNMQFYGTVAAGDELEAGKPVTLRNAFSVHNFMSQVPIRKPNGEQGVGLIQEMRLMPIHNNPGPIKVMRILVESFYDLEVEGRAKEFEEEGRAIEEDMRARKAAAVGIQLVRPGVSMPRLP